MTSPISPHCFITIPPENIKNIQFSHIFKGYKNVRLERNELNRLKRLRFLSTALTAEAIVTAKKGSRVKFFMICQAQTSHVHQNVND